MKDATSGRDIALILGGIAVGVLGSRLLPPLVAMGTGAARGSGGDPFAKLEDDHRLILAAVESMEQVQDTNTGKRMAQFLALKRKLGKHAMAEEDVVYPLLSEEGQRREAAMHLYEEHAQIKTMLFEIETAIMRGQSWSDPVRRLHQLLTGHIREEEDEQFPRLRQTLDAGRFSEVGAQVHREEALIL